MDAFQQSQRFMRPPHPPPQSMADPHHQQQPPPPPPPVPSQGPWFSPQFHYHQQWGPPQLPPPPPPPPHSDQLPPHPAYPPPHNNLMPPYPPQPLHNQFPPPPRPYMPPPPSHPHHPHSQNPQAYPHVNQEWGNSNWAQHQGWEYPDRSFPQNNEEDWAARARAWAAAKAATETQQPQVQFTPIGKQEEFSHYHDQYQQAVDPQYAAASSYRQPVSHQQESAFTGSESFSSNARDGTLAKETSPSVQKQEVSSSYSSVTGKEEVGDHNEHLYKSFPLLISSPQQGQQRMQSSVPPHFAYNSHLSSQANDLSDQPLDFAPRFNRGHDPHIPSSFIPDPVGSVIGMDPVGAVPSVHAWTPPIQPGIAYPQVPPVIQSGPKHDTSVPIPSPVTASVYGRIPVTNFPPNLPSFPGDAFGVSDRPKKASVPNWLREEIIKKKSEITSSAQEHGQLELHSFENEDVDKSIGKVDHADSKSIDSNRSTEDEDGDEDYVEATRTVSINQEIKRVLTDVLLKVTDELFDEIATKVLSEDDMTIEVDQNSEAVNQKVSPSSPLVPPSKATAKVLLPVKAKESEMENTSGKSSSSSPGNILGLANYASDDDEIQSLNRNQAVANGTSEPELEDHSGGQSQSTSLNDLNKNSSSGKEEKKINSVKRTDLSGNSELKDKISVEKLAPDSAEDKETKRKLESDRHENRSSTIKNFDKEEINIRKESSDEKNLLKERRKGTNPGEKEHLYDPRTNRDSKEDRKETERVKKANVKDHVERKIERTKDEKEDILRGPVELGKEKRKRSSSISRRGRNDKGSSSDEALEDSKRKVHSRRRNLSPSPVRSRRRRHSRSPHSKHSQRRHSPYSSLETTRGRRRSRSKSPAHRPR